MSRSLNETTIELSGRWLIETDKAVRFRVDMIGSREMLTPTVYWFPLSQVSSLLKQQPKEGEYKKDVLRVKEWLVTKNEMYEKLKPAGRRFEDGNVYGAAPFTTEEDELLDDGYQDDIPF